LNADGRAGLRHSMYTHPTALLSDSLDGFLVIPVIACLLCGTPGQAWSFGPKEMGEDKNGLFEQ